MKIDEPKTYKVRLCTFPESAGRLRSRLEKFYRRRAKSLVRPEPGMIEATMHSGARISCRFSEHGTSGRFASEPIAEMIVTATPSYMEYSVSAAMLYCLKADLHIHVETVEQKPRK